MTAIVGILNKKAVAVAADSAVTITGRNGEKTINTAEKIFTLSKFKPIGAMVYHSATFTETPISVIIKYYRDFELKKTEFNTLEEYATDFLMFLKSSNTFEASDTEYHYIKEKIDLFLGLLEHEYAKKNEYTSLDEYLTMASETLDKYEDSDDVNYTAETVNLDIEYLQQIVEEIEVRYNIPKLNQVTLDLFIKVVVKSLFKLHEGRYTGLFIYGYGEKEIFPRLHHYKLYGRLRECLKYKKVDEYLITHEKNAAIVPGAQTDVINTILVGSSDKIQNYRNHQLYQLGKDLLKNILGEYNLTDEHEQILQNLYQESNQKFAQWITNENISEIYSTVSYLDKKDLAEMVESLIYTTYLNKRVTSVPESVGGNVDVAVISKSDGFVWVKRKHYFPENLNHSYYKKYFDT